VFLWFLREPEVIGFHHQMVIGAGDIDVTGNNRFPIHG
jgi:hypothetical protein